MRPANLKKWIKDIKADGKVKEFNNGRHCGTNNIACGNLDICRDDDPSRQVEAQVMAANMGGCTKETKNTDSIVTRFSYRGLSILLSGDFQDLSLTSDGVQKEMVDYYGNLSVKVYHAAHHGAVSKANKMVWLDSIKPKAVVASGDPKGTYGHPRCEVCDSLCSLCWKENCPTGTMIQPNYTCGRPGGKDVELKLNNPKAIYTTVPNENQLNVITVSNTEACWKIEVTSYEARGRKRGHDDDESDGTPPKKKKGDKRDKMAASDIKSTKKETRTTAIHLTSTRKNTRMTTMHVMSTTKDTLMAATIHMMLTKKDTRMSKTPPRVDEKRQEWW